MTPKSDKAFARMLCFFSLGMVALGVASVALHEAGIMVVGGIIILVCISPMIVNIENQMNDELSGKQ